MKLYVKLFSQSLGRRIPRTMREMDRCRGADISALSLCYKNKRTACPL